MMELADVRGAFREAAEVGLWPADTVAGPHGENVYSLFFSQALPRGGGRRVFGATLV